MFVDPRAGIVEFLPLCNAYIDGMAKANANSKATYRSNFRNPAVVKVLAGPERAGSRADGRRGQDTCSTRRSAATAMKSGATSAASSPAPLTSASAGGRSPRHTLSGIELAPRIVTAEQYEQENKGLVFVPDDAVRALADGLTVKTCAKVGPRDRVTPGLGIAPWLQRTMGLRIREALGVRKADFKERDGRYPLPASVLAGQRERAGAGAA